MRKVSRIHASFVSLSVNNDDVALVFGTKEDLLGIDSSKVIPEVVIVMNSAVAAQLAMIMTTATNGIL